MKESKALVGSISKGTMRPYDLFHAFRGALKRIDSRAYDRLRKQSITSVLLPDEVIDDPNHEFWKSGAAISVVSLLMSALGRYSPRGYYFGTLEEEPSNFGYWKATK